MAYTDTLIAVTRLARVCRDEFNVSPNLREAIGRAKRALNSEDELRHLCQDAYDRISELEGKIRKLKNRAGNVA